MVIWEQRGGGFGRKEGVIGSSNAQSGTEKEARERRSERGYDTISGGWVASRLGPTSGLGNSKSEPTYPNKNTSASRVLHGKTTK